MQKVFHHHALTTANLSMAWELQEAGLDGLEVGGMEDRLAENPLPFSVTMQRRMRHFSHPGLAKAHCCHCLLSR